MELSSSFNMQSIHLSVTVEHLMDFMTVSSDKVHHLVLPALNNGHVKSVSLSFFTSVPVVGAGTDPQPRRSTFPFTFYTLVARD